MCWKSLVKPHYINLYMLYSMINNSTGLIYEKPLNREIVQVFNRIYTCNLSLVIQNRMHSLQGMFKCKRLLSWAYRPEIYLHRNIWGVWARCLSHGLYAVFIKLKPWKLLDFKHPSSLIPRLQPYIIEKEEKMKSGNEAKKKKRRNNINILCKLSQMYLF